VITLGDQEVRMKRTIAVILAAGLIVLGLTASTTAVTSSPGGVNDAASPGGVTDPDVVTTQGLAQIQVGDARAGLARDRGLTQRAGDCAPRLPDHPAASPVFDNDRLVLLWADPPLHTPEGIAVGTPVTTLHEVHPEGEHLPAEPGTHRFDGVLVADGAHAYLFLHDGTTVQKMIVGSAEHARLLFDEGFGTC
jgi:hypothetical protein